jgi:quercetin dioxygenase-like cupin family protein
MITRRLEIGAMHAVIRPQEYSLEPSPLYAEGSRGYTQASLVDRRHGSVHTGLTLNELAPGGRIAAHMHSFEKGVYVLNGTATLEVEGGPVRCGAGDFVALKVGTPHSWHNDSNAPVRWLQMSAPQPKPPGAERDTFFVHDGGAEAIAAGTPTSGVFRGHFDASQIPPAGERPTSFGPGVFLKWLIDEAFGAVHHRLVFIQYEPGARIPLHDHTFEESYFILSGEVEATLDGETHRVGPGGVVWTGVGCIHAFANVGSVPVQWLETFSPQPPRENVFRFMEEWRRRGAALEQGDYASLQKASL